MRSGSAAHRGLGFNWAAGAAWLVTLVACVGLMFYGDDFDGNGTPDLIWRHGPTGDNALWLMDGLVVTTAADTPPLADPRSDDTLSTRAMGEPRWHQSSRAVTRSSGPSATISTSPVATLRTQPVRPRRRASRRAPRS